jgi:hypothetical protein
MPDTTPIFRDDADEEQEDQPNPDVLPEGAARGGITVPDANDTGVTTPPISGWGETPAEEDDRAADR